MTSVIGIDVGGTGIKAGRYSADGALLGRAETPTPLGDDITAAVRAIARELFDEDTVAVGVVLPGIIDRADGVVRWSVNLGWRDVPLRSLVNSDLGVPVALEHDATAAALAEQEATGTDLFYVGLGTGIGAAYIVDGQPLRGVSGLAGELGHAPVRTDGEPCTCGQVGCLEVYASAAGIARRYLAHGGWPGRTSADVAAAQRVEPIDPIAAEVWRDAADALGTALATATLLLDPARIVLGGGLALAGDALVPPVQAALAERLTWRPAPLVTASLLGPDAGIRGAALLAQRRTPLVGATQQEQR
jgi:glucokinase